MKKITALALSLVACSTLSAIDYKADKYRVSLGGLPGVSGFTNAYLTDQIESGEGLTSEAAFMTFEDANSAGNNYNVSFAGGMTLNEKSSLWGELTYGFGAAQTILLTGALQYEVYRPVKSVSVSILPRFGYALVTQDMGTVPTFDGQINTAAGDFDSGEPITMDMSGLFVGISAEVDYHLSEKIAVFGNIGYGYSMMGTPTVSISEQPLSGDIFAAACAGSSSVDLVCSGYFDPFEGTGGLTGLTFQVGAQF